MSVTEERCERSDLLVSQCAHCQGHEPTTGTVTAEILRGASARAPIRLGRATAVRAQYPGRCAADARHRIEEDDWIYSSDAGWLCRECSGH